MDFLMRGQSGPDPPLALFSTQDFFFFLLCECIVLLQIITIKSLWSPILLN